MCVAPERADWAGQGGPGLCIRMCILHTRWSWLHDDLIHYTRVAYHVRDGLCHRVPFLQHHASPPPPPTHTPACPAVPAAYRTVFDLAKLSDLEGLPIACDSHCYGCTAGSGSSCQGSLALDPAAVGQ